MSSCPETHEKLGHFAADIQNLKSGHEMILTKMDKIEDKREVQFKTIDEKFNKQKWGLVLVIFTSSVSPFVAGSSFSKSVLSSLVVYIEKLLS